MPELAEPIKDINYWLQREYGVHEDGRPKFRVVWANDQLEKRWVTHTKEGLRLSQPEVVELPRYIGGYYHERYILEQLSVVPNTDRELTVDLSYEPLWIFRDKDNNYLPPRFDVAKIVVDAMFESLGVKKPVKKENSEEVLIARNAELKKTQEELFGNDTEVGDALAYGWGVSVPGREDQTKLGGLPSKSEEKF